MSIPVLMYHHIAPHVGDTVTVRPEVFAEHMRYIAAAGYRTVGMRELLDYCAGTLTLEENTVAITFDDGWLDNYLYAWPIMRRYGLKAVMFLITDRVEQASAYQGELPSSVPDHQASKESILRGEAGNVVLSWQLVRAMRESGLVEFYSHTVSHRNCRLLDDESLRHEIFESKRVLEERLAAECPCLCWPYGEYDARTVAVAREAGYKLLLTTKPGVVNPGSDPLFIERITVEDNEAWLASHLTTLHSHNDR